MLELILGHVEAIAVWCETGPALGAHYCHHLAEHLADIVLPLVLLYRLFFFIDVADETAAFAVTDVHLSCSLLAHSTVSNDTIFYKY